MIIDQVSIAWSLEKMNKQIFSTFCLLTVLHCSGAAQAGDVDCSKEGIRSWIGTSIFTHCFYLFPSSRTSFIPPGGGAVWVSRGGDHWLHRPGELWLVESSNTDLWLVESSNTELWLVESSNTELWLVDSSNTKLWLVVVPDGGLWPAGGVPAAVCAALQWRGAAAAGDTLHAGQTLTHCTSGIAYNSTKCQI